MKRRSFLGFVAGSLATWPLVSRSQARVHTIGIVMNVAETDVEGKLYLAALVKELTALGWTDGRNLQTHIRWAAGDPELVRKHAAEIATLEPDVTVAWGASILSALQAAKTTKPIVFLQITDPVRAGFVASLSRPGARSRASRNSNTTSAGSGFSCSKRLHRLRNGWSLFGTQPTQQAPDNWLR